MIQLAWTLIMGLFLADSWAQSPASLVPSGPVPLPWDAPRAQKGFSTITYDGLLRSVEERFPAARIANSEIQIKEGREASARGNFDFRLNGTWGGMEESYDQRILDFSLSRQIEGTPLQLYTGWRLGEGQFRPYEGQKVTGDEGELRAGFRLPLLRDLMADPARTQLGVARFRTLESRAEARFKILEMKRSAAEKFWEWVGATAELRAYSRLYSLAAERRDQIQKRVRAGVAAGMESIEIERMIVQRQAQLIEAERGYQKAALELSLFFRDESGFPLLPLPTEDREPLRLRPYSQKDFPELTEEGVGRVLATRGDVEALETSIQASQREVDLASQQRLPRLDAWMEYARDQGAPKDGETEVKAFVTLSFPLENREARGNFLAQRSRLDQLEASRTFLRDQVRQDLLNLSSAATAAYAKAQALAQDQDLSERLANAERQRFTDGISSLLIVNIREQSANDSLIKANESIIEYEKAKLRLFVSQGREPH